MHCCPCKTGTDPSRGGGMPYQAKPRPGRIAVPKGCWAQQSRGGAKCISTERRDQEGLEDNHAPSRQEWQDTSHLSITDTAPPHMVMEMQMMKEMMDFMINTLKVRVSNDLDELVHQTDSTFTAPVTSFPFLTKFRMPQIEAYDGSKDPLDHLELFKTLMHLQGVANEIMC